MLLINPPIIITIGIRSMSVFTSLNMIGIDGGGSDSIIKQRFLLCGYFGGWSEGQLSTIQTMKDLGHLFWRHAISRAVC